LLGVTNAYYFFKTQTDTEACVEYTNEVTQSHFLRTELSTTKTKQKELKAKILNCSSSQPTYNDEIYYMTGNELVSFAKETTKLLKYNQMLPVTPFFMDCAKLFVREFKIISTRIENLDSSLKTQEEREQSKYKECQQHKNKIN